ncbi:MAG: hypothetical protein ACI9F9_002921 [Candidatus Paceibacteria bacterium]|jgi:hypothetical protein
MSKYSWLNLPTLLLGAALLAGCPSDPSPGQQSPEALVPGSATATPASATGSILDEVNVMSPEEALDEATQSINEENVLDELNALEREISEN